jgi:cysteine desulfurase
VIDLVTAEKRIAAAPAPALVSVMWVNNETGVIQPIAALLEICRKHAALLHVDAVQALGRLSLDVPVDALTLSAHKVGGPLGVGALLLREGIELTPLLTGGGQERGRRAGTENVPAISGFAAAVQAAIAELPEFAQRARWRDAFEEKLLAVPGVEIIGRTAARVANTSCLVCPGFKSDLQLMQLDLKGIAASSGSACSSGKVARSHVLTAMGVSEAGMDSALRVSFGWNSKESELNFCAEIWTQLALSAIGKALSA